MPTFTGRLRTPALAAAPASPVAGELYYDTVANVLYYYTGSAWVNVASFNGRTGVVVPASGDYTAAQVTNAADKSSAGAQVFTGPVTTGPSAVNPGGGGASGVYLAGSLGRLGVFGSLNDLAFRISQITDTTYRYTMDINGLMNWGPGGSATLDTTLQRSAVGVLKVANVLRKARAAYAWATTVSIDPTLGEHHVITGVAGNTAAWTISMTGTQPASTETQWLTVEVFANAVALAIPTWSATFFKAPPLSIPGSGNKTTYVFRWTGTFWVLVATSAAYT